MQKYLHIFVLLWSAVVVVLGLTMVADGASTTQAVGEVSATQPSAGASVDGATSDLSSLTLEQLMQIEVTQTNTLTKTDRSLAPAAITTIDRDEIDQANSRSLTDLLSVYVPNFESKPNDFEQTTIGERGIVGDRDNKFLELVNGQEINERSHGFLPEQSLSLLGDLNEVDMVRGPGSSTYGPGAIAGVISMETLNGLDYQGTNVTARGGFLDEFYSVEAKHGQQLGPDAGWFVYAGGAQLTGASSTYAPIIQGTTVKTPAGEIEDGAPLPFSYSRENSEYDSTPQIKAHAEFDDGGLSAWVRYTRGGESDTIIADRRFYTSAPYGFTNSETGTPGYTGVGYDQLTGLVDYKGDLTSDIQVDSSLSYAITDFQRVISGDLYDDNQEQKATGKSTLTWQMGSSNQLAVGAEYREYYMGLPSWLPSPDGLINGSLTANGTDSAYTTPHAWNSFLLSGLVEDQWHIGKPLTLIVSARMDKDRYTNVLISPRAALAFQPNNLDTFKAIADQAQRTNDEEDMRAQRENSGELSKPETLTDYELRYERRQSEDLFLAGSVYYNRLYAVDWGGTSETPLGTYKTAGLELETDYRTKDDALTLSQGYTKLVGQNLKPAESDFITVANYGFGYDLAGWANSVTKLTASHKFDQHLSVDGNVQFLWGFAGDREDRRWENSMTTLSFGEANSSAFTPDLFLNLGLAYKIDDRATLRADAYNVLGWADPRLDKLESSNGNYRVAAPAFALTLSYSF